MKTRKRTKKINLQKSRQNFLYGNEKQTFLTLTCQTMAIIEKKYHQKTKIWQTISKQIQNKFIITK